MADAPSTRSETGAWWARTEHSAIASCVCGWKVVAVSGLAVTKLRAQAEHHHEECGMPVGITRNTYEALRHAPASAEVRGHRV